MKLEDMPPADIVSFARVITKIFGSENILSVRKKALMNLTFETFKGDVGLFLGGKMTITIEWNGKSLES